MSRPDNPAGGREWTEDERRAANQKMVRTMREAAARTDAQDLEHWRNASVEEHARVLKDVCDLADAIIESRGFPATKPPPLLLKRFLDEKRRSRE